MGGERRENGGPVLKANCSDEAYRPYGKTLLNRSLSWPDNSYHAMVQIIIILLTGLREAKVNLMISQYKVITVSLSESLPTIQPIPTVNYIHYICRPI